ncbi:probable chitinase 10 [Centruroides sculpturatus]|uniref:probable chitinase 10 n=1 Tax=Centruroides sculpturatus TaxID=218467 RepID=UPI000C6E095D|nr:probable chitinase 10 [Centruroides sculpturatus]
MIYTALILALHIIVSSAFDCKKDGYFQDPDDCQKFYNCDNGKAAQLTCGPGTVFNEKLKVCDFPNNVKWKKVIYETIKEKGYVWFLLPYECYVQTFHNYLGYIMEIQLLLLTLLPYLSSAYICGEDGYFRDPDDCSKYYWCVKGIAEEYNCAGKLVFNEKTKRCEWPENVDCENTVKVVRDAPMAANFGNKKVVCYFINWAWYRKDKGKYLPENVDPTLCTHINYAFAVLDATSHTIKPHDTWADIDNDFYKKIVNLKSKNPSVKVALAIGGWGDSAGNKYSVMVSDPAKRKKFIDHVIPFLKQYGFDGLDLDWEYPNCWQGACGSAPQDVNNFSAWIKELREAFNKQNPPLLLTAAVVAAKDKIDQAYDIPVLGQYLDHINIMTYDFHGGYDGKTGHHAQMYPRPGDVNPAYNVETAMQHWASKGAPKEKLILGVPFYGRSFTLSNPSANGLNQPATGNGNAGEFTNEGGFMAFYEICERVKSRGWTKARDDKAGPYAYQGNQWVGYDDAEAIAQKAKYAKDNGYGGIIIWDISMDDFSASCCSVKNPLMKAIQYGLTGQGTPPSAMGCE